MPRIRRCYACAFSASGGGPEWPEMFFPLDHGPKER
jgi:hypothetical protein